MAGRVVGALGRCDREFGGRYSIYGKVTERTTPKQMLIRLHDQKTGILIRETWSNTAGDYVFTNLNSNPTYVIAFDKDIPLYNAAIQDNVVPS